MYATTISDFRAALLNYQPPAEFEPAIYSAQAAASPVVQCVETFGALKGAADLDQPGLSLLLGAAYLIAAGGWHGKDASPGEAATILAARAGDLEALAPAPGDPV